MESESSLASKLGPTKEGSQVHGDALSNVKNELIPPSPPSPNAPGVPSGLPAGGIDTEASGDQKIAHCSGED
jgi:hypothetical protein